MELGEQKFNLNNEDDRKLIENSLKKKEGRIVMEYIFQIFEQEFNEDDIDLNQENYKVGEDFKVVKRYKNIKKYILRILDNNE